MAEEKIYPYAVAKIRVYEKNLLTKQTLIQMAEAKTAADSLRMIGEAGYDVGQILDEREFEAVLSHALSKTYTLVKSLLEGENFVDVFLYKNDFHNVKVLIKEEVSGVDGSPYLLSSGSISLDALKKAVLDKNYASLPKTMAAAVADCYDTYAKTQNGQVIDLILDKAAFAMMKETADLSGNDFIMEYVAKLCDLTNIKSFLRVRNMRKEMELYKTVFVLGGYIGLDTFRLAFAADNPVTIFKNTRYAQICEEATLQSFTAFEKACDDYMMAYVKSAKYHALTAEPLIAYLYAKESEVKTIRIIMTSKINHIDPDTIKERLREAYV